MWTKFEIGELRSKINFHIEETSQSRINRLVAEIKKYFFQSLERKSLDAGKAMHFTQTLE
mgnify:CR=1 FL=1